MRTRLGSPSPSTPPGPPRPAPGRERGTGRGRRRERGGSARAVAPRRSRVSDPARTPAATPGGRPDRWPPNATQATDAEEADGPAIVRAERVVAAQRPPRKGSREGNTPGWKGAEPTQNTARGVPPGRRRVWSRDPRSAATVAAWQPVSRAEASAGRRSAKRRRVSSSDVRAMAPQAQASLQWPQPVQASRPSTARRCPLGTSATWRASGELVNDTGARYREARRRWIAYGSFPAAVWPRGSPAARPRALSGERCRNDASSKSGTRPTSKPTCPRPAGA